MSSSEVFVAKAFQGYEFFSCSFHLSVFVARLSLLCSLPLWLQCYYYYYLMVVFRLYLTPSNKEFSQTARIFRRIRAELNNTVLCSSTLDVSIPVAFNFLKFLGVVLVFVKSVLLRYFYLHEPFIYAFLARVISLLLSLVRWMTCKVHCELWWSLQLFYLNNMASVSRQVTNCKWLPLNHVCTDFALRLFYIFAGIPMH